MFICRIIFLLLYLLRLDVFIIVVHNPKLVFIIITIIFVIIGKGERLDLAILLENTDQPSVFMTILYAVRSYLPYALSVQLQEMFGSIEEKGPGVDKEWAKPQVVKRVDSENNIYYPVYISDDDHFHDNNFALEPLQAYTDDEMMMLAATGNDVVHDYDEDNQSFINDDDYDDYDDVDNDDVWYGVKWVIETVGM